MIARVEKRPGPAGMPARIVLAAVILLVIATSRITVLQETGFDRDEVRSIWRTFGTPAQIVAWQPPDWPPLYYLAVGAWRSVVGIHPVVVRYSSVLLFVLACALLFRAARQLFRDDRAAWMAVAVYAALGLNVYLSTNLRGYALAMALFPLALWLTLRYFERPTWRRALALAVCMAAMFYTTYTAALAFAMLGLVTLVVYTRAVWRWWLPGIVALGLAMPALLDVATVAGENLAAAPEARVWEPLLEGVLRLYSRYAGDAFAVWVVLFALATGLILYRRHLCRSRTVAALAWAALGPVVALSTGPLLGTAASRYSWWATPGIALWLGLGLGCLPRRAWLAACGLVLALMFFPIPEYGLPKVPFEQTFPALEKAMEPGDVVLIDPNCYNEGCGRIEEWDYYRRVYFADGRLHLVSDPGDHRRVWYVRQDGWQDQATQDAVREGRLAGPIIGPWNFLLQLYEAPPNTTGTLFENGMRFHGFDIIDATGITNTPPVLHEGDALQVRLWWSIDRRIELDYSVSTRITDGSGAIVAQFDGPPQTINLHPFGETPPQATSAWETGRYYVEERLIVLPDMLSPSLRYTPLTLSLTVYQWWDGKRIRAPGVNSDDLLPLGRLYVLVW